jgi:hypothetical protein
MIMDLPPPNPLIVCIETHPGDPPGVHALTVKTLKYLRSVLSDYEAREARRLKFEASLANELKDFTASPSLPDNEIGFMVVFKRDCQNG